MSDVTSVTSLSKYSLEESDDNDSFVSSDSLIHNAKLGSAHTITTKMSTRANERFLRRQYLIKRSNRLRKRLVDRPYDQSALQEYAAVLYEQQNFIVAAKVIKRVMDTGDKSGHWYLKLGKCFFRRWLIYYSKNGTFSADDFNSSQ